jgi:hypothetical protein
MSAEAGALAAVEDLLEASATWAALFGAEYQGEGPATAPNSAFAVLDIESGPEFSREGIDTWSGTISVRAEIMLPPTAGSDQAMLSAARSSLADIRADILSAAPLTLISAESEAPQRLEESAAFAGWFSAALVLTFQAIP